MGLLHRGSTVVRFDLILLLIALLSVACGGNTDDSISGDGDVLIDGDDVVSDGDENQEDGDTTDGDSLPMAKRADVAAVSPVPYRCIRNGK
jgi:hypothetical protein